MIERWNGRWRIEYLDDSLTLGEMRIEVRGDTIHLISGDDFRSVDNRFIAYWRSHDTQIVGSGVTFRRETRTSTGQSYTGAVRLTQISLQVLEGDFEDDDGATGRMRLTKLSDQYRQMTAEIDRIAGRPAPPTVNHEGRAWDLAGIYSNAGIDLEVRLSQDDMQAITDGYSDAELHNALSNREHGEDPADWYGYIFMTNKSRSSPGLLGLMFDIGDVDTNHIPREGCVVFTDEFDKYSAGLHRNLLLLRTTAHEFGHSLNLPHPRDEGRPRGTTLMNQTGDIFALDQDNFPLNASFRFLESNLEHLRHGPHPSVIFGGLAFGRRLADQGEPPAGYNDPRLELSAQVDKVQVRMGEPLIVQIKVRNVGNSPVPINDFLHPRAGLIELWANCPSGRTRRFRPILRVCPSERVGTLMPGDAVADDVVVLADSLGPFFTEPGRHEIRLEFVGILDRRAGKVRSEPIAVRVHHPSTPQEQILDDLDTSGPLMYLELGGADHLEPQIAPLREFAQRHADQLGGLRDRIKIADGNRFSQPFHDVVRDEVRPAELQQASEILDSIESRSRPIVNRLIDDIKARYLRIE